MFLHQTFHPKYINTDCKTIGLNGRTDKLHSTIQNSEGGIKMSGYSTENRLVSENQNKGKKKDDKSFYELNLNYTNKFKFKQFKIAYFSIF